VEGSRTSVKRPRRRLRILHAIARLSPFAATAILRNVVRMQSSPRFNRRVGALVGLAVAALTVPVGVAIAEAGGSATSVPTSPACEVGEPFVRTELFFGLSRPGGRITERQFDRFVDAEVTPRFPDGLTLLSGEGQFRLADGEIVEERSKQLILLHGGEDIDSKEIEEIRSTYIAQFDQQSVLRTDETSCVSF